MKQYGVSNKKPRKVIKIVEDQDFDLDLSTARETFEPGITEETKPQDDTEGDISLSNKSLDASLSGHTDEEDTEKELIDEETSEEDNEK